MKLPFLASFLLLIGILFLRVKISNREIEKQENEFWEKERNANCIRKKSLDSLAYIHIPEAILTLENPAQDATIARCLSTLSSLKDTPIVNLTGISNTDLKLTYGTANITPLTQYDQNYTQMVICLQELANACAEAGRIDDAIRILEFSVSTRVDISKSYYLLASLYQQKNTPQKIASLITMAENIPSALSPTIVRTLQEYGR